MLGKSTRTMARVCAMAVLLCAGLAETTVAFTAFAPRGGQAAPLPECAARRQRSAFSAASRVYVPASARRMSGEKR